MQLKVPCTGLKAVLQYVEFHGLHAVLQRHTSQENFCVIVLDKAKLTYPRAKTLCPSVPWNAAQDSYHRSSKLNRILERDAFLRSIDYSSRRAFSDANACDGSVRSTALCPIQIYNPRTRLGPDITQKRR